MHAWERKTLANWDLYYRMCKHAYCNESLKMLYVLYDIILASTFSI